MPNHVLQLDCTNGLGDVEVDLVVTPTDVWVEFDIAFNAAFITAALALANGTSVNLQSSAGSGAIFSALEQSTGTLRWKIGTAALFTPSPAVTSMQFYHVKQHLQAGSPGTYQMWIGGTDIGTSTAESVGNFEFHDLSEDLTDAGSFVYYDNFQVGTTEGASDLGSDDFEGGSLAFWNSSTEDASIIVDPGIAPSQDVTAVVGRVFIAFDDGPLEPTPAWTCIDQGGDFPDGFVSGYDITSGRQTLLSQTDTGSATIYINDHEQALFDPRNTSSPYFGKLDGRQILLQLYDPVAGVWRSQFRGHIDDWSYVIDGSAADENGDPINASIQIQCVDIFDYLAGYGLTPGLDGVMPTPAGGEDGVWYAETTGTVDDRIIEILNDVGIDSDRYVVFSGNNTVQEVKYDPDESALVALRDACDAEFPFIANMYVDRFGRFVFHGRYGRFDPAGVAADAGTANWDFHHWKLGDGKAVLADATRTQIRVLEYSRARSEIVNVSVAFPANMPVAQMPNQVYADTTSITDYGKHAAPPMSDLLVASAVFDSTGRYPETLKFAELLVKNQKDPRESITAIQLKSIQTSNPNAANVWSCLTESDVSDLANVKVGYPDGTGLTGASTVDDYFIEGRQMTVRPSGATYDYVELNLELSPFVWSADTHSVFPPRS